MSLPKSSILLWKMKSLSELAILWSTKTLMDELGVVLNPDLLTGSEKISLFEMK
jgi:hypothetical protein